MEASSIALPCNHPEQQSAPAQFPGETWLLQPRHWKELRTAAKFPPELQPPVLCLLWNKAGCQEGDWGDSGLGAQLWEATRSLVTFPKVEEDCATRKYQHALVPPWLKQA